MPPKPKRLRISTHDSTVDKPKLSRENDISLGTLPDDIIREIIRVGRAPLIDSMRNISPRWNTLCINHISDRKNNPIIESIECYFDLGDLYQIEIKVPFELQNYFGLNKWKNRNGTKKTEGIYLRRFNKDEAIDRKLENFLQELCFRADRIDKLSFYTGHSYWQRHLNMLTRATGNIDIGTLEITTSRSDFETTRFLLFLPKMLRLAENHKLEQLTITTLGNDDFTPAVLKNDNLCKFISTAALRIPSVKLIFTDFTRDISMEDWYRAFNDMCARLWLDITWKIYRLRDLHNLSIEIVRA